MSITPREMIKLLELSKLHMEEDELTKFNEDICQIEEFLKVLKEVPLEEIPPCMAMNTMEDLREDEALPYIDLEVKALAAEIYEGFVMVPPVLKGKEKSHEHI